MFSSQEECRQACARHLETGGEKVTDEDENVSETPQIHLMALSMMARALNSSQKGDESVENYQTKEDDISRDHALEVDFEVHFEADNIEEHDNNEEIECPEEPECDTEVGAKISSSSCMTFQKKLTKK